MSATVDTATVREFIEAIHSYAAQAINGAADPGLLQLVHIHPTNGDVLVTRYQLGDMDHMVENAIASATAGYNVYIEGRTVRAGLPGNKRGKIEDTVWVFALVIDSDGDKGKGWTPTTQATLVIATSPGNSHHWFCFNQAITAEEGQQLGEQLRNSSGADKDTGVVTQCYRVAGTPNFPDQAKRKRGRTTVEPTSITERNGMISSIALPVIGNDETTLPDDLLQIIRQGGDPNADRSALFHSVVAQLKRRRWNITEIVTLLEKYPNGIAQKYLNRIGKEVERSYAKINTTGSAGTALQAMSTPPAAGAAPGSSSASAASASGATAAAGASSTPPVLPTIRLVAGQLPRAVEETERALLSSGAPIFKRAGVLVEPVSETMAAADGRKTTVARLRPMCADSLLEPIAEAALFQRFNPKRNTWVDVDPPIRLVRMILARERRWKLPRVSGVITTPTLRADGSLLAAPGYDPHSELYLLSELQLPPIPEHPTREQAQEALALLTEPFSEFSFQDKKLDRAVALAGLLTAQVRGSLPTAPIFLMRANTAGTGKSYLVDLIAMITTGWFCPVITTSKSAEETEKRIGSVLLDGTSIVSLDNCAHDLEGELLCQLSERPVIKIRILGRSEMPKCECRTAVFATGNNVAFKGDMVRRGLVCNLETLMERPELREFRFDVLEQAANNRGAYVAAILTIVRAYLAAGAPRVCGPIGSYRAWSTMVRSPLIWVGEPDPVASMESVRAEDPELANIREFFDLWLAYDLDLDQPYTTNRIIEIASAPPAANDFNPPALKLMLMRVAADQDGVSAMRLGWWLKKISGRVVNGYRLIKGGTAPARFLLTKLKQK